MPAGVYNYWPPTGFRLLGVLGFRGLGFQGFRV